MSTIQPAPKQQNRRLQTFICHSSGDKSAVRDLYRRLIVDGFAPWLDEEDIIPGQEWQEEIPKAVRASDVVLVCLSKSSVNKEGFVNKEIKFALDKADEKPPGIIFIVPVRLEEVDVPERLSKWQWVNLFKQDGYQKLVRALQIRVRELGITITESVQPEPAPSRGREVTTGTPVLVAGTVETNPNDGQKYVWIPPGTFQMGCSAGDSKCRDNEQPAHRVKISKGFWLGQTPVTQAAYRRVMGDNRSHFRGENLPVESVTWNQARTYCEKVGMRLPTEAEWEYAARAGRDAARYGDLDAVAWYERNSGGKTHDVGLKEANGWGLHDMLGNVWEWVEDLYEEEYYAKSPSVDPVGPASGKQRVLRGGSWFFESRILRYSYRNWLRPDDRFYDLGFRCVWDVVP